MSSNRSASIAVTGNLLHTRRHTIALDEIDKVSVIRPLALVLAPASLLLVLIAAVFWADWQTSEAAVLIGAAIVGGGAAYGVGELKLHSLSLRDASVFGPVWQLESVRVEIEESIFAQRQARPASSRRKEASSI